MFKVLDFSLKYWQKPRRDNALFRGVSDAVEKAKRHDTHLDGIDMLFPQFRVP